MRARGRKVIGISGSPNWSKTLMVNPPVNFGAVRRVQLAKSTLLSSTRGLWDVLRFLSSVEMLKREWGAESNGKLLHIFIPSKTATLVPEFAGEDLPLGRISAMVPGFAMKDLLLTRTLR